jgi:DNA recombination-mediator protein A/DprA-like N-terminal HHH domain
MGGAWLVNGERAGTRAAPLSDTAVAGPTASVIAEEDETLYARYDTARIPPAIPYIAPDDLPVPSDDLSDPDPPYWLALNRVKGIGPARFRLLLDAFGSAAEIWRGSPQAWRAAGLDARTTEAFERQRPTIAPDAELERLIRLRVRAIRFIDPGYPKLLSEIPLPPAILYVRGAVTAEDEWALAVVGTRRASAYGRQMTERLVRELAAQRITIVSGLVALLYSI